MNGWRAWRNLIEAVAQLAMLIMVFASFDHPTRFGEFLALFAVSVLLDIASEVRKINQRSGVRG